MLHPPHSDAPVDPQALASPAGGRPPHRQRHWVLTVRLTVGLLVVWGMVTFGLIWFARDLDAFVLGWPLSFYMAAQGSLLVFLAIVGVYAAVMAGMERRYAAAAAIPAAAEDGH